MVGIDIIRIERIKKAAESAHFVGRVFSPNEISYAKNKVDNIQTLAGIYAAKEAVAKALKRGFSGLNLKDIEIKHDEKGCPFALVAHQVVQLSISHDGGFAIAVAIVEPSTVQNIRSALNKVSTSIDFSSLPDIKEFKFPPRFKDSHKRCYAAVKIIGGSADMVGAPFLSAKAALKSGSGLVKLCVAESLKAAYQTRVTEETLMFLPDENGFIIFNAASLSAVIKDADSIAIGMGMGTNPGLSKIIEYLCKNFRGALIIDADGLNALSNDLSVIDGHVCTLILTPHMGEFFRLNPSAATNGSLALAASDFAAKHNCVLVLKSHETLITDGVRSYKYTSGTPAMAKGGTGDILSGIIASLCAYMPPVDACAYACHALGDSALKKERKLSADGVLASDLCDGIELDSKSDLGAESE